jgi:hypothetical protein
MEELDALEQGSMMDISRPATADADPESLKRHDEAELEPRAAEPQEDSVPAAAPPTSSLPRGSERARSELACDDEGQFEEFQPSVYCDDLPIVVFTDDVKEQRIWHRGMAVDGRIRKPRGRPDVVQREPVVMSCAYLGFSIEPYEERYLHYRGVGMVFSRPRRGEFMQPSIDTVLVCHAVHKVLEKAADDGQSFPRIMDVGAGSGFIGKFAAVHAPPGLREVCLVDTDPAAKEYWQKPEFGSSIVAHADWSFHVGDACKLLERDSKFDLVISNPPYIPTRAEASSEEGVSHVSGFWEGCGLLVHLMELMEKGAYPEGAHLVLALTSLTLKSRQVCKLLSAAPSRGIRVRQLLEREIGWKAWYAGRGSGPEYLLATPKERQERQKLGECDYFVGCCEPGESRQGGERDRLWGYHWHVAYVLDIYRETVPAG